MKIAILLKKRLYFTENTPKSTKKHPIWGVFNMEWLGGFCEEPRRLVNRFSSVAADGAQKSAVPGFTRKSARRLRILALGRFL
jgi:hypothetical protein